MYLLSVYIKTLQQSQLVLTNNHDHLHLTNITQTHSERVLRVGFPIPSLVNEWYKNWPNNLSPNRTQIYTFYQTREGKGVGSIWKLEPAGVSLAAPAADVGLKCKMTILSKLVFNPETPFYLAIKTSVGKALFYLFKRTKSEWEVLNIYLWLISKIIYLMVWPPGSAGWWCCWLFLIKPRYWFKSPQSLQADNLLGTISHIIIISLVFMFDQFSVSWFVLECSSQEGGNKNKLKIRKLFP